MVPPGFAAGQATGSAGQSPTLMHPRTLRAVPEESFATVEPQPFLARTR
jgi:hypothetical protein